MRPNEANAREPFKAIPKFIGCEWVQTNDPIISMASGDKKGVGKMAGRISQPISNFEVFYGGCNCGSVKIICIQARLTIDISKEFKHFFKCVLHFQSVCAILTTVIEIEINILD